MPKIIFKNGKFFIVARRRFLRKKKPSNFPVSYKDFLLNKSLALKLVRHKIAKFNAIYGFKYNKITIRRVSSRWGSCSAKGNLNFNYKIVYLKDDLADYIVAHELCHLQEMNHGAGFWKLVAKTMPNWRFLRKQLKQIF